MKSRHAFLTVGLIGCLLASCESNTSPQADRERLLSALGEKIFFDTTLSNPTGQSCASCHTPSAAFSDPTHAVVSPGANPKLFGYRNAPSIAYACYAPLLHFDAHDSTWAGGLFLDGRARTLKDQAAQPVMNPLEMNAGGAGAIATTLRQAPYFSDFQKIFGNAANDDSLMLQMSDAVAAFERSPVFRPFSSKFDAYRAGRVALDDRELRGFQLFKGKALCAECHTAEPDENTGRVLFTDFTYDNLGVPANPNNPYYRVSPIHNPRGEEFKDEGLGAALRLSRWRGYFKVPTLRNIALTAPYFHNGYFSNLEEVVHWYNVRDSGTHMGLYPKPEIEENVNHEELGNLHLSRRDEADLVVFLRTLTDGYR